MRGGASDEGSYEGALQTRGRMRGGASDDKSAYGDTLDEGAFQMTGCMGRFRRGRASDDWSKEGVPGHQEGHQKRSKRAMRPIYWGEYRIG